MNIDSNTPDSLDCQNSIYSYSPAGHVISIILMSSLTPELAILFLKALNIDFPLILISLNVVWRLLFH